MTAAMHPAITSAQRNGVPPGHPEGEDVVARVAGGRHVDEIVVAGVVAFVALFASGLAAVAGFGGAVVLLPVLVWAFGVRDAIPILTTIQVVGNASRVGFNRHEIVWPVAVWFALGAVPLASLAD